MTHRKLLEYLFRNSIKVDNDNKRQNINWVINKTIPEGIINALVDKAQNKCWYLKSSEISMNVNSNIIHNFDIVYSASKHQFSRALEIYEEVATTRLLSTNPCSEIKLRESKECNMHHNDILDALASFGAKVNFEQEYECSFEQPTEKGNEMNVKAKNMYVITIGSGEMTKVGDKFNLDKDDVNLATAKQAIIALSKQATALEAEYKAISADLGGTVPEFISKEHFDKLNEVKAIVAEITKICD